MKGPFVPLSVSYYENERVLNVSPMAELLYVRGLAFSKGKMLEGVLGERQVARLAADLEGDGLTAELERVGLWTRVPGGWLIEGWTEWNALDTSRVAGMLGNHERWHVRRGLKDLDCPHCLAPESPPDIAPESPPESQNRVEENREEKRLGAAKAAPTTRKRRTTVADSFVVTDALRAWAKDKNLLFDLDRETEQFAEYHRAKGSLMADWDAAWRKWMGKAAEYAAERNGSPRQAPLEEAPWVT